MTMDAVNEAHAQYKSVSGTEGIFMGCLFIAIIFLCGAVFGAVLELWFAIGVNP